ncbi:MAG: 3-hydroxyacyl-ACP dehydratase FabZ family protein [Chloroflexota bacterium]
MSRWTGLDRIVSLEGDTGKALRNVPHTLSILDTHFARRPVLPGVLILGSLGELAGLLLKERTGKPWRLAEAQQVRFRHFIQPGDQMELTVSLKSLADDTATFSGTVTVDGRSMTTARLLRLVPKTARTETGGDR